MRVLLITASARQRPTPSGVPIEEGSPAAVLGELGCDLAIRGLDLDDLDAALAPPPVAILLDTREHLESGYACLRQLRARPELAETPALLVVTTARLSRLDFGAADDFVLHPIVPAELYARLRQLDWRLSAFRSDERIKVGDLVIDLAGYEAHLRDRRLELTHKEFELLAYLARHRGKVQTRKHLLARVWGYRPSFDEDGTRTVDIHVRRLRAKLGPTGERLIGTVRGVGYKLAAD